MIFRVVGRMKNRRARAATTSRNPASRNATTGAAQSETQPTRHDERAERFRAFHKPSDRNFTAGRGGALGRYAGLLAAVGFLAAASGLPDCSSLYPASRR